MKAERQITHRYGRTWENPAMAFSLWNMLYRRLGRHYPAFFITLELQTAFFITAGTLALFTFFYDAPGGAYLKTLAVVEGLTILGVALTLKRTYPRLKPIKDWISGQRDENSTSRAWAASINLPLHLIKADIKIPTLVVVIPGCAAATHFLGLGWTSIFPLIAGSMVALGYSGLLHYLAVEAGMRPVLIEINQEVSPRRTPARAISLRTRLLAAAPAINVVAGFVVAAITSNGGGISVRILIAVGIAGMISLELTLLLARSILTPLADLQDATKRLARGEYDTAVPITTGDELGELAASFNQMVSGLAEREQLREAFGTYLDRSVAEVLLSGNIPDDGIELDVSVLFFDVRDFTEFSAKASAKEVVARLNALFETTVPIIARHGGHVDKFMGDGLMAIFGAPENFPDHAERAVRAACELEAAVNRDDDLGFHIGIGINSGEVVAGSIGGAGRLNFSVIGDAVNVAARVESATREVTPDILVTPATAERLGSGFELKSQGVHQLKGIDKELELFEPTAIASDGPAPGEEPLPVPETAEMGHSDGLGRSRTGPLAQL
jgi:class 3 adenylate cyclase